MPRARIDGESLGLSARPSLGLLPAGRQLAGGLEGPDLPLEVLQHPPDPLQPDDLPPLPAESEVGQTGPADPLHVVDVPGQEGYVQIVTAPGGCLQRFLFLAPRGLPLAPGQLLCV